MKNIIHKYLQTRRQKLVEEEERLNEKYNSDNDNNYKNVVDELYAHLSIIDSKSSALLTFNAIGLAVLAIWLEGIPPNLFHLYLDIVFVLVLVSCGFLLLTVKIYWDSSSANKSGGKSVAALLKKKRNRTDLYKAAWWISAISIFILTVLSVLHGIHTWKHSAGLCEPNCIHMEGAWGHISE